MNLKLERPDLLLWTEIRLPGSKSISNRVLIIKALSGLDFLIQNTSDSDDTKYLQSALNNYKESPLINVGHAGTDMRFLTAFLCLQSGEFQLTGSARLQQRPVGDLVTVLRSLGAEIFFQKEDGYPPLFIKGKALKGGSADISGKISSQFITALLLVAPYFQDGLTVNISDEPVSKSYIEMTIAIMKEFGAEVEWTDDAIKVKPVKYVYNKKSYYVESDWSAASYYYSVIALSPLQTKLTLFGLFHPSVQADSVCDQVFKYFGVTTEYRENQIVLTKSKQHNTADRLELNLVHCPDITQTLVSTCIGLKCPFHFTGLQTLKVKETDRIAALKTEAKKLGAELEVSENSIHWTPANAMKQGTELIISTYDDHRMAMSFAPLCLVYDKIKIEDAEVVSKSYPLFWKHLKQIGINQTTL